MKSILLICTEPFVAERKHSGWYRFTLPIVNALAKSSGHKITFLYCKQADNFAVENQIAGNVRAIPFNLPKNRWLRLIFRIYPYSFLKKCLKTISESNFDLIHFLAVDYMAANILKPLQKRVPVIWTVHDLIPHDSDGFYQKFINLLVLKCIRVADNLATCSRFQEKELKKLYPNKSVFYFPLPTQINEFVKNGNSVCPELHSITKYILFFGRILTYKGIEILYQAWEKSGLSKDVKLVVAGKSNYNPFGNFEINKNLVFIDRTIENDEISQLFKKSACVVYPYISITQSAVIGFPYYFGTPVIASDLDFFKEQIIDGETGFLFEKGNSDDLAKKLKKVFDGSVDLKGIRENQKAQYAKLYDEGGLRSRLEDGYKGI